MGFCFCVFLSLDCRWWCQSASEVVQGLNTIQYKDSQDFIKTLKDENSLMRGELKTLQEKLEEAAKIEELLEHQQTINTTTETDPKDPPVNRDELLAELKKDVLGELSAAEQEAKKTTNIEKSMKRAEELFGEEYMKSLIYRLGE